MDDCEQSIHDAPIKNVKMAAQDDVLMPAQFAVKSCTQLPRKKREITNEIHSILLNSI